MASSSSSSSSLNREKFNKEFTEEQNRQDKVTQRRLDAHFSSMHYYMELSDSTDLEKQIETYSSFHFDWSIYKSMDVVKDTSIDRYTSHPDYYTSLQSIDVLLRPAVGNIKLNREYEDSIHTWLADLPSILGCSIRCTEHTSKFDEAEYTSLQFTGHEYILERIPSVKLYIVTVSDTKTKITKVFDYFFYYFTQQ